VASVADLSVGDAHIEGRVMHVLLGVNPPPPTTTPAPGPQLPSRLEVHMSLQGVQRGPDAQKLPPGGIPLILSAAMDLVAAPETPSGVTLRVRMQLTQDPLLTPVPPDGATTLSTVAPLHIPVPADLRDSAPPDPDAPGGPATDPVELALPITSPSAHPPTQTVQLNPPPLADGSPVPAAVSVAVSVTAPADPAPAADSAQAADPTPTPTPSATP
jgi:hypothetical protein